MLSWWRISKPIRREFSNFAIQILGKSFWILLTHSKGTTSTSTCDCAVLHPTYAVCSAHCAHLYPLELSNPSWHVDTPDHYCWSTLGIVVSLTCQPGLAPSTVATSYNRLCCLQMINLGLAYGIMIQAECIPMFVTINQHFIFSYQECTLCVGLFS